MQDHKTGIASVSVCRELRAAPGEEESTVHMELDISDTKLTYRTADNLGTTVCIRMHAFAFIRMRACLPVCVALPGCVRACVRALLAGVGGSTGVSE